MTQYSGGVICAKSRFRAGEISTVAIAIFAAVSLLSPCIVHAQALHLDYAAVFSGVNDGQATPARVTIDASGNAYITGSFTGTVDFDPGAGTSTLSSAEGSPDIFVERLDSSGALVWVRRIGGASGGIGTDEGADIAVDTSGNVYVTGDFFGTVDFDPGAGMANLTATTNGGFALKLDSSGNYVWAVGSGDFGTGIAVDGSGNVYVTGYFFGTFDFDPGAGTANGISSGSADIFVQALNSSGGLLWVATMGGTDEDRPAAIAVDGSSNVYVTGSFRGTADFDPGAGTTNLVSAGSLDEFVVQLDSSGALVWAGASGGTGDDAGQDITLDASDNVLISGYLQSATADFDPGVGVFDLSASVSAGFVQKLTSAGVFSWAVATEGVSTESIAADASSNVYTAGSFAGTIDFDPGAGTANLTSAGLGDACVRTLDSSGNFVAAYATGGTGSENGLGLAVGSTSNVYLLGSFIDSFDLDPGPGLTQVSQSAHAGAFIQTLSSGGGLVYGGALVSQNAEDAGSRVAVDAAGNAYIAGSFTGVVDFDPGAGASTLTSAGLSDFFIIKLDPTGALLWAKRIGGANAETQITIAVDSTGNSYLTGYFTGTVDFDPGAGTSSQTASNANSDLFILKLDTSGNFVWIKRIGTSEAAIGSAIALDSTGNILVGGTFSGTPSVDFDPGPGTFNLAMPATSGDAFILKLNAAGDFVWAKAFGANGYDNVAGVVSDSAGNVLTTGFFQLTVDFDPGAGTFNLTSVSSTRDIFVLKLDASGAFVWAKQIGSTNTDEGAAIAVDAAGSAFVAGKFLGTADFDPGAGTFNLTPAGGVGPDSFLVKLDSSGAFDWAEAVGSAGLEGDQAFGVAVDGAGNVVMTGSFLSSVDFDPGPGTANLTSTTMNAIFVQKLDTNGNYLWAGAVEHGYQINFPVLDGFGGIAVTPSGEPIVTGRFYHTADFDPGAGTQNLTGGAFGDAFVWKLGIIDTDGDGVANWDESNVFATNPNDSDSDNDGLLDGEEVYTYHTNPKSADTDGDGISDGYEVNVYGTSPTSRDTDGDGLSDASEVNVYGTNPMLADTDADGLSDGSEMNVYSTNPNDSDSDNDGLSDGAEVSTYGTNPSAADSDGDTVNDGEEVQLGMNPAAADLESGTSGAIGDLATAQFQLTIGAGNPVQVLTDLNVRLYITHPNDADLNVSLISPSGTSIVLVPNLGGSGNNFTNTWLDDEAATAITEQIAPFTGHFRPSQALAAFDGEDPQGTWTLKIEDQTVGNSGTLVSWGMSMTTTDRGFLFSPAWVNFSVGAGGNGSISSPFNTLVEALTRVTTGGRVKMITGSTTIHPTINQNVNLDAPGGLVRIGAP